MATSKKTPLTAIPTRALTVCQPWAWAIVAGFKSVENRTWDTKFRGTLAIHASSSKRHLTYDAESILIDAGDHVFDAINDPRFTPENPCWYPSAIIGTVDVIGCVDVPDPSGFNRAVEAAGHGDWLRDKCHSVPPAYWAEGTKCWLLANPVQFTVPVASKGALNIWHLSADQQAAIAKELARKPRILPVDYVDMMEKAAAGKGGKAKAGPAKKKAVAK